jgi:hypothetical protein
MMGRRIANLSFVLLAVGAMCPAGYAYGASLVKVPEARVRGYLAELTVVSVYCRGLKLRHNMVDLVWDILELKTARDPNDADQVELMTSDLNRLEARFKENPEIECERAYRQYGPSGSAIRDLIYRN